MQQEECVILQRECGKGRAPKEFLRRLEADSDALGKLPAFQEGLHFQPEYLALMSTLDLNGLKVHGQIREVLQ